MRLECPTMLRILDASTVSEPLTGGPGYSLLQSVTGRLCEPVCSRDDFRTEIHDLQDTLLDATPKAASSAMLRFPCKA